MYPLLKAVNTEVKSNYVYWLRNNVYYLGLWDRLGVVMWEAPLYAVNITGMAFWDPEKNVSSMDSLSLLPQCQDYKCVAPCLVFHVASALYLSISLYSN